MDFLMDHVTEDWSNDAIFDQINAALISKNLTNSKRFNSGVRVKPV